MKIEDYLKEPDAIGGTTAAAAAFTTIAVPELTSAAAIALVATTDVTIPANVGLTFGTGEKIEGDNTDLTVTSGGAINLTATTDVIIPANVGITFGTGEKIEGDNTDLTVTSGGLLKLSSTSGMQANLIAAPAADTYVGFTIALTAHENMGAIGALGFINSSGEVALTDADAAATMPGCVMATAATLADASGVFLLPGSVIHLHTLAPAWTVGGLVYAGSGAGPHTPGALNQTPPAGDSDIVQIVGVALAADILLFIPSLVTVEVHA
jgi:hypothetical protein